MRAANRLPRRPFLATRDLGYYRRPDGVEGPGMVFRSGPFKRRRFKTYERARAWAGDAPAGLVHQLQWTPAKEEEQ